jgi:glutathione peroxidase
MTIAQKIKSGFYPALMAAGRFFKMKGNIFINKKRIKPNVPIYSLYTETNMGESVCFHDYKGKYLLIANTASDCGYTAQYSELQQLQTDLHGKLQVIAFPANDFGGQEPSSDSEIANFCETNFGVSFPIMMKSDVVGPNKNEIFEWLSNPEKNGWNKKEPNWNFCKYLVSPDGTLVGVYESAVSPLSKEITGEIR